MSPSAGAMAAALGVSWAGLAVHNLAELGLAPWRLESSGPAVVGAVLALAYRRRPGRAVAWALAGWAGLNLIGGAVVTVLPLRALPFAPAQTVSHYVAHAGYGLSQLPLAWLSLRALSGVEGPTGLGSRAG